MSGDRAANAEFGAPRLPLIYSVYVTLFEGFNFGAAGYSFFFSAILALYMLRQPSQQK
jgi:hypothetical protein